MNEDVKLIEGEDFYLEGAYFVFTERYLLRRGYCCRSGCRHCPYRGGAESIEGAAAETFAEDAGGDAGGDGRTPRARVSRAD